MTHEDPSQDAYTYFCRLTARLTDQKVPGPNADEEGVFLYPKYQGKSSEETFSLTYDIYESGEGPEFFESEAYNDDWAFFVRGCGYRNLTHLDGPGAKKEAQELDTYLSTPGGDKLDEMIRSIDDAETPNVATLRLKVLQALEHSTEGTVEGIGEMSLPNKSVTVRYHCKDPEHEKPRPQLEFVFDARPFKAGSAGETVVGE